MIRNGSTGDWIGTFQGHKGAVWGVALDDTGLLAATGVSGLSSVYVCTHIVIGILLRWVANSKLIFRAYSGRRARGRPRVAYAM